MPTTRCKFHCNSVETFEGSSPTKVKLSAVFPQAGLDDFEHGEDHAFFNATPFGLIELSIQNPYGAEMFQPGKNFYVDFTEAPKPEPVTA